MSMGGLWVRKLKSYSVKLACQKSDRKKNEKKMQGIAILNLNNTSLSIMKETMYDTGIDVN